MIIKGNVVYVFDVEVFPNVFSCTIKNTNNKQITIFEISPRKNDVKELITFFMQPKRLFCGYNNIHYDNQLINYLIETQPIMHTVDMITLELKKLSDQIIESEQGKSKYKYNTKYQFMDLLTMLFSSKLRVGLKEMQVTMRYHNVQEYEGSFNKQLPIDKIDEMLAYNINDVESTEELLYRKIDDIKLRLGIEKEFGVECLSKDGMTIGNEILKIKYLEASGKKWDEIKNLRNHKEEVALKDIILPFIKFDTPSLQAMLEEMKTLTVSPGRKGYEKHILVGGLEHVVSVGGLHSANTPEIIIPNDDEVLLDSDVNSMYPSTIIAHKCYPRHLGEIWLESYKKILNDRLEAKHSGNTLKNSTLKLALNG